MLLSHRMNENMRFLEKERRWFEMNRHPLVTMRQELRGLVVAKKNKESR